MVKKINNFISILFLHLALKFLYFAKIVEIQEANPLRKCLFFQSRQTILSGYNLQTADQYFPDACIQKVN